MKKGKLNRKLWALLMCVSMAVCLCGCNKTPQTPDETMEYITTMTGQLSQEKKLTGFTSDTFHEVGFESGTLELKDFYIGTEIPEEYCDTYIMLKTKSAQRYGETVYITPEYFIADDICIPTEYGLLHFSSEWNDYLSIITDNQVYKFCYTDENESAELFTVSFGEGTGVLKGTVDKGDVPVYVEINLMGVCSDRVCAMAEGVNYLISELASLKGFVPAE